MSDISPNELQKALAHLALWYLRNPQTGPKDEDATTQQARETAMQTLSAIKAGDVDPWLGKAIKTVVRKSTRYLIYLDNDCTIQWWWIMKPPNEELVGYVQAQINRLQDESAFLLRPSDLRTRMYGLKALKDDSLLDPKRAETIRGLIAESMAVALNNGSREECDRVLKQAEDQILVAKDQLCRPIFVRTFLYVIAIFALAYVVLIYACDPTCDPSRCMGWNNFARLWHDAAIAGAIGALTSALLRSGQLRMEPNSQARGIQIDAFARAMVGAVAGVMTSFAFESNLFVKAALGNGSTEALRLFLCLAAGASERLLPNLISRAENMLSGSAGAVTPPSPPAPAAKPPV
jgi:hypothetical protein